MSIERHFGPRVELELERPQTLGNWAYVYENLPYSDTTLIDTNQWLIDTEIDKIIQYYKGLGKQQTQEAEPAA